MQLQYWLAPHVHLCRTERQYILLDLKRDEYVSLDIAIDAVLRDRVYGWPSAQALPTRDDRSVDRPSSTEASLTSLQEMIDAGIFVTRQDRGKYATPVTVPNPSIALVDGYADVDVNITAVDIISLLTAITRTNILLRFRSLERVAAHVHRRRKKHSNRRNEASTAFEIERARRHVCAFRRLRPWAFTSNKHCFFDSLVLCEFLALRGVFPMWIFGVSVDPFAAHCWLQDSDIVIDDMPANVRSYTPIMAL